MLGQPPLLEVFFTLVPAVSAIYLGTNLAKYFEVKDKSLLGYALFLAVVVAPMTVGCVLTFNYLNMKDMPEVIVVTVSVWWVVGLNLIVESISGFSFFKYFFFEQRPAWGLFVIVLSMSLFVYILCGLLEEIANKIIKEKSKDSENNNNDNKGDYR